MDLYYWSFCIAENQPPTWDVTSVDKIYRGVPENTAIGTFLTNLKCNDPEGDPINYFLRSGKAVKVFTNGTVVVATNLDFEAKDTFGYDLTLTCVDVDRLTGNPLHLEVENRVQITVNDANDNPPTFTVDSNEGYSFSISEVEKVGTILTPPIRTTDLDRTDNAVLDKLYLICNSPNSSERINLTESSIATCQHFRIDYKQESEGVYVANLSLTAELDYETRPVFSSKLVAIDGPKAATQLTTTINVQIVVIDAQDVNPLFTNIGASTSVSEGAAIGTTLSFAISARDGDKGDKRPVVIDIISDEKQAFTLTNTVPSKNTDGIYEAQLVVRNQLDREKISGAYNFIVKVTELDKQTRNRTTATATATYSVFVTDINDNAPTFGRSTYNISILELEQNNMNQSLQITGLHITCSDLDEPINARYNVTVLNQTFPAFSVSPQVTFTGNASMFLKVENPMYLDYDIPEYRQQAIILLAREINTKEQFSGSTTVMLTLLDLNDNAPVFSTNTYNFSISEDVKSVNFTEIKATDKDSNENGRISYKLEGETGILFSIDSTTGVLYMRGDLDYETTSVYVFRVYATDNGNPPKSALAQVVVNILDYNDMGPRFLLPNYQTAVNESSLVFLNPVVVQAVDDDAVSNVTYRIKQGQSPNKAFEMNPFTGQLTLREFLNYDDTPLDATGNRTGVFVLLIEASDNGNPPQANQVEVRVTVIDENNHSPELAQTNYYKTISEIEPPGTVIAQIKATDLDSGDFGKITYRIGEGQSDNFFINPNTGLLTVNQNNVFDVDVASRFTLIIYATDGGAPQRSATATVSVTVTDANNKDPFFSRLIYPITVDETTPLNTVLLTVTATDFDSTQSLTYYIDSNSIIAYDRNGNILTSTGQYDYKNAFGVKQNGDIYVKGVLNKNLAQDFRFTLYCRDINTQKGNGTGNTQITVNVQGKAESGISCDPVNQIFVNEDYPVKKSPITVTARDTNNVAVYNYTKLRGSSLFSVDKLTGQIILEQKLDYENDPEVDHLHTIVVGAYSGNNSATCTVTVSVVDVNDNPPMFQNSPYRAVVSESSLYPTDIISIYATDDDSKSFGPLEFTLSESPGSDDFQLFHEPVPFGARTSRRVHVLVAEGKTLDYNSRSSYDLTLLVNDNDGLQYSTVRLYNSAKLTIDVKDENNNKPNFKENYRSVSVPETAELGRSIATLIATDADRGRNGEIVYSLIPVDSGDSLTGTRLFSILPFVGTINVASSLIGLGGAKFNMFARACDGGDIPNCGQMTLDIYVLSTENDDGNPKWIYPLVGFVLSAPEETPNYVLTYNNKTKFFEVNPRHGNNITYELSPYTPFASSFKINNVTGEITITGILDREVQETYNLLVYAVEYYNGTSYRTGRSFYVTLLDNDDNTATFTNPRDYDGCVKIDRPLVVRVKENTPANESIFILSACDPDGPGNNGIVYKLYNDNVYCAQQNNISGISLYNNGTLFTRRMLDYEQEKEYNLCVEAVSSNYPQGRKKRSFDLSKVNTSLDNVAFVNIQIIDLDDNGPKFPNPNGYGALESEPKAGPVVQMNAVDPDGPGNNEILYRIESSIFYPSSGSPLPVTGAFTLRGDKKAVYPAFSNYVNYIGGHFEIVLVASDPADSSMSDRQTINIFIFDNRQALKLILNLQPSVGFTKAEPLVDELGRVSSSYYFSYIQASEHSSDDRVIADMTDVCFLVVRIDSNSKTILTIRDAIDLLDQSKYKDVWSKPDYKAVDRGQCYPAQSSEKNVKWRNLWWVLVALAIFLFVCCFILIILVAILYDRYKSYMTTRKTYLISQ
ncbi:hypothetical protein Btru_035617 [Bulinus truncatus]|nr:hypothetical protein Btru_035617 [Bulinus truncatus]